jgi:hypothetical protein
MHYKLSTDGSVHYKFSLRWEHAFQILLPLGVCIIRSRLMPDRALPRGLCMILASSGSRPWALISCKALGWCLTLYMRSWNFSMAENLNILLQLFLVKRLSIVVLWSCFRVSSSQPINLWSVPLNNQLSPECRTHDMTMELGFSLRGASYCGSLRGASYCGSLRDASYCGRRFERTLAIGL